MIPTLLNKNTARILFAACVLFLLVSCRSQKVVTVPVERVRTEYVHDTIQRTDSIWRDRWHTMWAKGDTIYIHDSIFVGEYRNVEQIAETVIHDSIPVIREVEVKVPEEHGFLYKSGIALWVIIGLIILAVVAGVFIKFAK